jgi:hypothetical protein
MLKVDPAKVFRWPAKLRLSPVACVGLAVLQRWLLQKLVPLL